MRVELRTGTAEDTREVGEALATLLRPGDAVSLTGELGAGKTTLVQGVARGLAITDLVVSPTFTLVREYRGRLPLVHADVYRLDRVQDVIDLGLEDSWEREGVLFVEWGDVVPELFPEDRLEIELTTPDPEGDERRLVISAAGASWAPRWERLEGTVERWRAAA
jgi:tRNA threonylcarbamoyladenosine biosynthesis protein TsaE